MKWFILFVLLIISSFIQSQNVNLSNGLVFDGEPYLVIDPGNPNHMVVAWMSWKFNQNIVIKTRVSFDRGETWSPPVYLPHTASDYTSADPSMAFNKDGELFLSFIDFSGFESANFDGGVFVSKSSDGGLSWGGAIPVISESSDPGKSCFDRPWITIDTSTNSPGNIYITTINGKNAQSGYNPYLSISTDNGNSFQWRYLDTLGWESGPIIKKPMATPVVSSNGIFNAIYPSYMPLQNLYPYYFLAQSVNGNSFTYSIIYQPLYIISDTLAKTGYLLIANPSNANHLAFIFMSINYGDADVMLMESFDSGTNWSTPLRVNDDPEGNGKMQDMIWADFNDDGDLFVSWRDRRNGADSTYSTDYEFWGAFRNRDSTIFNPNFRISDTIVAFDTILNYSGNDFMCSKLNSDTLYSVWGDTRNGKLNIWFTKMLADSGSVNFVRELSNETIPEVQIFPNPSRSIVNIKGKALQKLEIYDIKGNLIQQLILNSDLESFDISNYCPGIYYLSITTLYGTIKKKMLIE